MDAYSLLQNFSEKGVKVWADGDNIKIKSKLGVMSESEKSFISANKVEILSALIAAGHTEQTIVTGETSRYPLTPLQQAYWVGETGLYQYSSPAFFYEEYQAKKVDVERLTNCIRVLVARHEMLRTRIYPDATQGTISVDKVEPFVIGCTDISKLSKQDRSKYLLEFRNKFQREVASTQDYPHFFVHIHHWKKGRIVHFLGRFIIGDGWSWTFFLKELATLYANASYELDEIGYSFRNYIAHLSDRTESNRYQRSLTYWQKRIPEMPLPPQLPVQEKQVNSKDAWQFMTRRSFMLDEASWLKLVKATRFRKLTPSNVLCTAFGEVLAIWSRSMHFIINLMYTRREVLHPDIEKVFGNFGATLLLEIDLRSQLSFQENARKIQSQLFQDLEHSDVAGVDVVRILNQKNGGGHELPSVPVVFASMVNDRDNTEQVALDKLGWEKQYDTISTPQVLIDLQVEDHGLGIRINMDSHDSYYEDGVIDQLFNAYQQLVELLVNSDTAWGQAIYPQLSLDFLTVRETVNSTQENLEGGCLNETYKPHLLGNADNTAVVTLGLNYSYADLHHKSIHLAELISSHHSYKEGDIIAVIADKSFAQLASVLAVLHCRATYLPISPATPLERVSYQLQSCRVSLILKEAGLNLPCLDDEGEYKIIEVDNTVTDAIETNLPVILNPEQLAYIIFTSGSTGRPKGVMIKHAAAVNTIRDINRRFSVGDKDRVLAFSPVTFDLSVYDIFGTLAAGGAIVLPDSRFIQDPRYLINLIIDNAITVINCVPAVVEMIIEQAELQNLRLDSVRLIMMSGDWIPVSLPKRINAVSQAQVVSLGGATEAAIWSCFYEIASVDSSWKSIPYGYPLANQKMYVLNERMEYCPNNVAGEIYIGGTGLAEGYWREEDKTINAFVKHKLTGERLYRTGDWGQYHEDGAIEFLGRQDSQVKIRGYRIELGEIESVLSKVKGVDQAVVEVLQEDKTNVGLIAFLKPASGATLETELIEEYLLTTVPAYMVPSNWFVLEQLPLTNNGKVDRKALKGYPTVQKGQSQSFVKPRTSFEIDLVDIWKQVLGIQNISITRNFFELGGNSLLVVRMLSLVEKHFGIHIPLHEILSTNTIEGLASFLSKNVSTDVSQHIVCLNKKTDAQNLFLIHPIGGNLLCYSELVKQLGKEYAIYGLQSSVLDKSSDSSIESIADAYLQDIVRTSSKGPYLIVGWSFGGVVGYEVTIKLRKMGLDVALVMIDPWVSNVSDQSFNHNDFIRGFASDLIEGEKLPSWFTEPDRDNTDMRISDVLDCLQQYDTKFSVLSAKNFKQFFGIYTKNRRALINYVPSRSDCNILVVAAEEISVALTQYLQPLDAFVTDNDELIEKYKRHVISSSNHYNIVKKPLVEQVVNAIQSGLQSWQVKS